MWQSHRKEKSNEQRKKRHSPLRCILHREEYGAAKRMTGEQVLELFAKYGLVDYLSKYYDVLHTQGRQWLIEEIDEFIEIRKNKEA